MATKRVSGRIAARKAKVAEMAIKDPEMHRTTKRGGFREQTKLWTASEKDKLLEALRKFGTADIARLKGAVPNRSEAAVKSFVEREKVKMTQVYREVVLPDGRVKVSSNLY